MLLQPWMWFVILFLLAVVGSWWAPHDGLSRYEFERDLDDDEFAITLAQSRYEHDVTTIEELEAELDEALRGEKPPHTLRAWNETHRGPLMAQHYIDAGYPNLFHQPPAPDYADASEPGDW